MKKFRMPFNLNGIFLDADLERIVNITLEQINDYGELALLGDLHLGHKTLSRTVLKGYLNYLLQNKHIAIGLMGDIVEFGAGSDFIREEDVPSLDDQIRLFKGLFAPFSNRIKFILWGNHEERFAKKIGSELLVHDMALELGLDSDKGDIVIAPPQRGLYLSITVGDKLYGGYVAHSRTRAIINQDLQLQRSGSQNLVSFNAFGHTHRLGWRPRTFRTLEVLNGEVLNVVRRQYLISTGTFLKYPSYAEANSMPFTDVGAPILRFYANQNKLEVHDLTGVYKQYAEKGGIQFQPLPQLTHQYEKRTITKHSSPILSPETHETI